jgi:type IV fimbrial biogenesis protein FimT
VGKLDGLTVIELAVLVAVASILAAASVPALRSLILDVRMTRQVNAFVHSIHLAKQEAHKQTRYVAICKSPDGRQCQHDAAWREGWMVFVNSDRDEPPQVDAGERVLQVIARYKGGGIGANRSSFVVPSCSAMHADATPPKQLSSATPDDRASSTARS